VVAVRVTGGVEFARTAADEPQSTQIGNRA
jgi:hypothetical protein